MAKGSVRILYGAGANYVKGVDKLSARYAKIAAKLGPTIRADLYKAVDPLVADIKAICPVSELTVHPGDLRESVHKEPGRIDLGIAVVEDAKDKDGNFVGPHVEFGHKTPEGGHVPAYPHFYPSVRRGKKKVKAAISRACSKAIREAAI